MRLLILSKHYPVDSIDSSGVFVRRWHERLEKYGFEARLGIRNALWADIIVGHWLWWGGVVGAALSLVLRKPLFIVLHGDPYMIAGHWWVRVVARLILRRAYCIQVVSTRCERLMREWCPETADKLMVIPAL